MPDTTVNIEPIEGKNALIASISGQIDESNADSIAQEFYKSIEGAAGGTTYLFDLTNLNFINSKGIGYLLDFYRKINEKQGKMLLAAVTDNVLDILNVVGVTKVITPYATVNEAKEAI